MSSSGTASVGSSSLPICTGTPRRQRARGSRTCQTTAPAADEAHQCLSIGAYRGALILARAVVEATCKDKGAKGAKLYQRIETLRDLDKISTRTAQVAHTVRDLENDMAHGDFDIEVSEESAAGVLRLVDQILDEVYQTPALLDRLAEKHGDGE